MFYHPYVGVWLRVRACNPRLEVSVESEVVVFLEEFISVALWDGDWFRCWLDKGSLRINPDLLFAHTVQWEPFSSDKLTLANLR